MREIERLTSALNEYPDQTIANAVRLLLLTGARRGEILTATWEQFGLETGVWTKPGAKTKQKTVHRVPLSALAVQVLIEQRERTSGAYVFPGRVPGQPFRDIKKAWRTICEAAGLQNVRVHDLRHTYASILAGRGLSLPIIGRLLGHTQPGPTARYAHLYDDPLREATERVTSVVRGDTTPGGGEVVDFNEANPQRRR